MAIREISSYHLGDMLLVFEEETEFHRVGFYMIPWSMQKDRVLDRKFYRINSLAQVKIAGDMYPNCYGNGQTMRNGESANRMDYKSQREVATECGKEIHTYFEDARGYELENVITYYHGEDSFEMKNIFTNKAEEKVSLEMLSSFEMGDISPFLEGIGTDALLVHRLRSKWSHEGRLVTETVEDLQLEPSWSNWSVGVERFGQRGSMPVMKYFPFVAVEDSVNHIVWGVQLAHEASWQMEVYRQDDGLHITGGLADREFGHWMKEIQPGESFETPKAILSVCQGDVDLMCHRLVSAGEKYMENVPESEQSLPIVFNEYCTTWGNPSDENISEILEAIKGKGFEYFVIDCGWFKEDGVPWDVSMGDYNVSPSLFPQGLEKTVERIREKGMKPGIWFEIDTVGPRARAFENTDHLLKRDGMPLSTYTRRFWDMTDPWVQDYLGEKVIGTLQKYGFEYMKMDYNDTIGIGCDGCESLGEGLRRNMEASVDFVRRVKEEVPGIILENCASGGHKLEPLMMSLCSMASFSDAHETEEIPIIAANLHRAVLPRQSQIWAVIREKDSLKRIGYSITNTFLGRMCLSGDVTHLTEEQWDVIDRGIAFYKEISHIIKKGRTYHVSEKLTSDRHPEGYQVVVRVGEKGQALVVIHCFHGELPEYIEVKLPEGCGQQILSSYAYVAPEVKVENGHLLYKTTENMNAAAVHLC